MIVRALIALLLLSSQIYGAKAPVWEKLEGCTLVPNKWNDGDSFHVAHAGNEFLLRLYFVDCPETDPRFPERVAEQAAYFGVSAARSLEIGKEASQYTTRLLEALPFTVYTCWQKAPGSSKLQRHYAMVLTRQGWLDRLLVQNGLARIYGKRITQPDGMTSPAYRELLDRLEVSARARRAGG